MARGAKGSDGGPPTERFGYLRHTDAPVNDGLWTPGSVVPSWKGAD